MSRKRRLVDISESTTKHVDLATQPPPAKKAKFVTTTNDCTDPMAIFNMKDIKHTVLEYVPFNDENFELFLEHAEDDYIQRRFWFFRKTDILVIKQRIGKQTELFPIQEACNFYGNVKVLFGDGFWNKFISVPLPFPTEHVLQIDDTTECNIYSCSEDTKLFRFEFPSPRDLTSLFDEHQRAFFGKYQINIDMVQIIIFCCTENAGIRITVVDTQNINAMISFSFGMYCKPDIIGLKLHNTFKLHTKDLLPSIKDLQINVNGENELYIDHDSQTHALNLIELFGVSSEHKIPINVHLLSVLPRGFSLRDERDSILINYVNFFKQNPWMISDKETSFIKQCKGITEDDHESFNMQHLLHDNYWGEINEGMVRYLDRESNVYPFKLNQKERGELTSVLGGFALAKNNETRVQIRTSMIPQHWEYFATERQCSEVNIIFDGFTKNLKRFSIANIDVRIEGRMDWKDIPETMECIAVSCIDFERISKVFPFLFAKNEDLSFKPVIFKFYLPSADSSTKGLKQVLLNQASSMFYVMQFDGYIIEEMPHTMFLIQMHRD